MKPLIKWPGGKRGELAQILPLIPRNYDRYVEPFVGGGALYFELAPHKAVIGDTSEDLIAFYCLLQEEDSQLHELLDTYEQTFSALRILCEANADLLLELYRLWETGVKEQMSLAKLKPHLALTDSIAMDDSVLSRLIDQPKEYRILMENTVEDKLNRTVKNNSGGTFTPQALLDNLTTGFMSGYYLYQRHLFNEMAAGRDQVSEARRIANFYFIREYCYGSMFRYNARGRFNIPYGGLSYNNKDFAGKIRTMFSSDVCDLLGRTQIVCEDFETLLRGLDLTERDFIFLDPPYDTEFSEYERHRFGPEDHERLAEYLKQTRARFLLVIKNTDFIYHLYQGHFRILSFENRYTYNVRSRNDRKAEHLLITNMEECT